MTRPVSTTVSKSRMAGFDANSCSGETRLAGNRDRLMFHQWLCCTTPFDVPSVACLTPVGHQCSSIHAVGKALITDRMVNGRVPICALREVAIGPWVVPLDTS